ncbi:hypothetical protein [Sediminicoccus sp. KRV36]|uniref:hypothetical protein n=1 Tax=Sediminicoccus sp. KRV36 TaxID=3133721 RepID=UPI00200D4DD7|nr:hypothetical protein [Sediminicoccus rosea]UPY38900.1 hypothetical protein LHU95_09445 [Sediminicoccus rosea]
MLEPVGTTTRGVSLRAVGGPGMVCIGGVAGDRWTSGHFEPMEAIPTGTLLTTCSGGVAGFMAMRLQRLVEQVGQGSLPL